MRGLAYLNPRRAAIGTCRSSGQRLSGEEIDKALLVGDDADGCLTYMSSHVASKLEDFGVTTIGARLSDVFRLDNFVRHSQEA